jgi:hypothetical protein
MPEITPEITPEIRPRHRFDRFVISWNSHQGQGTPDLHLRMARWLERCYRTGRHELLLLAFRDSGKSTIVGLYAAWRLYRARDTRILVLAADDGLARKMVRTVKGIIERHPWCAGLKPRDRQQWGSGAFTIIRRRVGRDPSMQAAGVTANFTGSHADLVICDDVEVPNTCDTAPKREDLRRRLAEIPHVLGPGGTVLYIGTPHTVYSIYARQPQTELGEVEPFLAGFARQELPVQDRTGNSLWPERFDSETIARIRRRSGHNRFMSQMMLTPLPLGEGRLDPDRLRPYDDDVSITEGNGQPLLFLGGRRMLNARAWWDPALATGSGGHAGSHGGSNKGDGSVLAVVFTDADGHAWLHRITWVHSGPDETEAAQAQCRAVVAVLASLSIPTLHIETNGVGGFLPGLLRQALTAAGHPCSIRPESSSRSKTLRILEAFEARLAAGALHAHRSVWDTPLIQEMREWRPGGRGHDDGLDAVAGCLLAEPVRLPQRNPPARRPDWRGRTVPFLADTDFDL